MKKYHIYLDQLNFFSILQEDFVGHLKLASLPSKVVRFWWNFMALANLPYKAEEADYFTHKKVLTLSSSFKV